MRTALVDAASNTVVNIIMFNPETDEALDGFLYVPADTAVGTVIVDGLYDPVTGEFSRNPQQQAEYDAKIAAEQAALEAEAWQ